MNEESGIKGQMDSKPAKEDAVVQTPHGERYKVHLINLTGHPIDDE